MEFNCKLAHQESVKCLSNFKSVKELYEKLSHAFSVSVDDILYCTLNSHNFRDMNSLLGNYLSHGDLIVAHICGKSKEVSFVKSHELLGLTITDNGMGKAFAKKIKSDENIITEGIKPGDHIAALNGESTTGMRHYEVAKLIRDAPLNSNLIIRLIEPIYSDEYINLSCNNIPTSTIESTKSNTNEQNHISTNDKHVRNDLSINCLPSEDLDETSLPMDKLLSKRAFTETTVGSFSQSELYENIINTINTALESFVGINDNTVAVQIYRLVKDNENSYEKYLDAINRSELSVFNFDDEIKQALWNATLNINNKSVFSDFGRVSD